MRGRRRLREDVPSAAFLEVLEEPSSFLRPPHLHPQPHLTAKPNLNLDLDPNLDLKPTTTRYYSFSN